MHFNSLPNHIRMVEGPLPEGAAPSAQAPAPAEQPQNQPEETHEEQDKSGPGEDTAEDDNPNRRGGHRQVLADLARERDKRQEAEARVKELERGQMSELEKAQAERADAVAERDAALEKLAVLERTKQAADLAKELGIPAGMAGRIQGTTPEEMRTDAEALAKEIGPFTGPHDKSAGQGGNAQAANSLEGALAAHYR